MNSRFLHLVSLNFLLWVLISLFVRPGFFDPITPSHSDLYRYVTISENAWSYHEWLNPRPLMIAFLKLLSLSPDYKVFYFLLSLPAVFFISSFILVLEEMTNIKFTWSAISLYVLIIIGSPLFYPIYQYDFGGVLSGLLSCIAILSYIQFGRKTSTSSFLIYLIPALFFWLSIEMKPTYALAIVGFICAYVLITKFSRTSLHLLCIAVLIIIAVFIKDKILGSKFLRFDTASDAYTISISPSRNIHLLLFYLKVGLPPILLVTTIISALSCWFNNKKEYILFIVLAALGAAAPMALLVNRQWDIYGWYPQIILCSLILFGATFLIEKVNSNVAVNIKLKNTFALFLVCLSALIYCNKPSTTTEWTKLNQRYSRNVLNALSNIDFKSHEKYLFANISGPYHPFKNTQFLAENFHSLKNFNVLLREREREWNDMSHEQTNGLYFNDIKIEGFSKIFIFDDKGSLIKEVTHEYLQKKSGPTLEALLLCGVDLDELSQNALGISKAVECLYNENRYESANHVAELAEENKIDFAWLYFHHARTLDALKNKEDAQKMISKALAQDPSNPIFIELQTKLK